eukprot:GEZU01024305.1.p1 GENE.GEZU01024305.1~~GEZU01024305.1.p1  ORF type:complete len:633 (-),score=102.39 GEZU01024305.1:748-2646(-)
MSNNNNISLLCSLARDDPLRVVTELYDSEQQRIGQSPPLDDALLHKRVQQHFEHIFESESEYSKIPFIDDVIAVSSSSSSPTNQAKLVRVRCMIQDIFDMELYLPTYVDKEGKKRAAIYHDTISTQISDTEDAMMFDPFSNYNQSNLLERRTLFCVPIPGESKWAKELYRGKTTQRSTGAKNKRVRDSNGLDDIDEEMPSATTVPVVPTLVSNDESISAGSLKKARQQVPAPSSTATTATSTTATAQPLQPANEPTTNLYPIPGSELVDNTPCLVKVYSEVDGVLRLCDVIELVGIYNPSASVPSNQLTQNPDLGDIFQNNSNDSPFGSRMIPQVHCVFYKKLENYHPLLLASPTLSIPQNECVNIRNALITFMANYALGGDMLSAEYLLLHIVSRVYARRGSYALGKFALNLMNSPRDNVLFSLKLSTLISNLVPESHLVQFTREQMMTLRCVPRKDYETNRIVPGILQLVNGTHLIVNQNVLSEGTIDERGIKNLNALRQLVRFQTVLYDFEYHTIEMYADIPVLILSEGNSLIDADCRIPLASNTFTLDSNLSFGIDAEALQRCREYIAYVTHQINFDFGDEMSKFAENAFVTERKTNEAVNADTFHSWLTCSRYGLKTGTTDTVGNIG